MELKIVHLYHDLLNSYGDDGNISILKRRASLRGIDVEIEKISVGDSIKGADIIFIGGGQSAEAEIAAKDISGKAEFLKNYAEDNGVILAVAEGFMLLGETFETEDGEVLSGAKVLPINEKNAKEKAVGDVILDNALEEIVGFENHKKKINIGKVTPLGIVRMGRGNNSDDRKEGAIYKNVIGTNLHGPLLSKNPALSDDILKRALLKKYGECVLTPIDDELEILAKKEILKRKEK